MPLRTTVVGSYPKPAYLSIPGWFTVGSTIKYNAGQFTEHQKTCDQQGKVELRTTVVGSYPKPCYLHIPDWFTHDRPTEYCCSDFQGFDAHADREEIQACLDRALQEVVAEQEVFGVDVITDGELSRDNYVFHFCRHLKNFDFENLTYKEYRNGACKVHVPTIRGKLETVEGAEGWSAREWEKTQKMATTSLVKYTLPGPMTITNTTFDAFYQDMRAQSEDLIRVINAEVRALAAAGCKHIQIDEPILVRLPQVAMDFGIDHLARCFEGVGPEVVKTIHLCCGYPHHLDQKDYPKADKDAYITIAEKLDNAGFDLISIEDTHRRNDMELFKKFKKSGIILGAVKIASSQVETEEEIRERVKEVLQYIPAERLWLAPDCGLGFLPQDILQQKMTNLCRVAKSL